MEKEIVSTVEADSQSSGALTYYIAFCATLGLTALNYRVGGNIVRTPLREASLTLTGSLSGVSLIICFRKMITHDRQIASMTQESQQPHSVYRTYQLPEDIQDGYYDATCHEEWQAAQDQPTRSSGEDTWVPPS